MGRHEEVWKVRISAPPERGKANRALIKLLASVLDVERRRISIRAGETSRDKLVEVAGATTAELERALRAAAAR
jgi:uncharacterized protein (TIGR00251 family)